MDTDKISCPLCGKYFASSVIEAHANKCCFLNESASDKDKWTSWDKILLKDSSPNNKNSKLKDSSPSNRSSKLLKDSSPSSRNSILLKDSSPSSKNISLKSAHVKRANSVDLPQKRKTSSLDQSFLEEEDFKVDIPEKSVTIVIFSLFY